MEYLDHFKYISLLAELERVKGTKKPLRDFINKVYNLSNNFNILTARDEKAPESFRYYFMIASRALSYNTGNIIIRDKLIRDLASLGKALLTSGAITTENVLETYEFWEEKLYIDIRILDDVYVLEPLIAKMNPDNVTVYVGLLTEFFMYSKTEKAVSLYLKRVLSPDNAISRIIDKKSGTLEKYDQEYIRKQVLAVIERHTQILKELDEHYSTSSDAVE